MFKAVDPTMKSEVKKTKELEIDWKCIVYCGRVAWMATINFETET